MDFLVQYKDFIIIILSSISIIVTILFSLFGFKSSTLNKLASAIALIPDFINQAEAAHKTGELKYQMVFNLVLSELEALGISKAVALKKYSGLIDSAIESILSTPHKKSEVKK